MSRPLTVTVALNFMVVQNESVVRIVEQRNKVIEADELAGKAKGIDALQRVPQRFACGPDKENQRDNQLRRDQHIGQPARAEYRTG